MSGHFGRSVALKPVKKTKVLGFRNPVNFTYKRSFLSVVNC